MNPDLTVHATPTHRRGWLWTLLLCCAATACARQPAPVEFTGWFKEYNGCREEYEAIDARVAAAGVGDAAYYRVPGFPYLRTDRALASYGREVKGVDQVGYWLQRMRDYDQEAREYEYINLGMTTREAAIQRFRFLNCGKGLTALELDDPVRFSQLLAAVQPPDDYSTLARTVGLYPLAVPFVRSHISAEDDASLHELSEPVDRLKAAAPLRLWSVKPAADLSLAVDALPHAIPDDLGQPGLVDSAWQALAEYNAPNLWIETAGDSDVPAAPELTSTGPSADVHQPLVNYRVSFTRFGSIPLAQISYFIWFKGANSADMGPLDGFIWRVTLDTKGQALVYESLHESGRDHRWFPVQQMPRRQVSDYWQEPAVVAPGLAPPRFVTLRLGAGTHALRHVTGPEPAQAAQAQQYELRPYEDLFTLPRPAAESGTRSLFDSDGLVRGTYSADPAGWFAIGLRQPGRLREYGHHAIAHIGRVEFDDPFLLESVFVPDPAKPMPSASPPDEP